MWEPAKPVESNGIWHSMVRAAGATDDEPDVVTYIYSGTGQVHATQEQAEDAARRVAQSWNEANN